MELHYNLKNLKNQAKNEILKYSDFPPLKNPYFLIKTFKMVARSQF